MRPATLSRRKWLRGASSVALALPALEFFAPAGARAASNKPRLLVYYLPNGRRPEWWVPINSASGLQYPAEASALQPYADQTLALVNLSNNAAKASPGAAHAMGTGTVMTGRQIGSIAGGRLENGISVDQLIVEQLKPATRFTSLQWSAGEPGPCDVGGTSCSYTQSISWTGRARPLTPTIDPLAAFNRLFGRGVDGLTGTDADIRRGSLKSVLDFVQDDAHRLQSQLGSSDRKRIDEYFTSVRELEQNLQGSDNVCQQATGLAIGSPAYPERVKAFHQLIKLAFECDQTRIISFMIEFGLSGRSHDFLNAPGGHHALSHYGNPTEYERLRVVERWQNTQLAAMLQLLRSTPGQSGGTLLDETIVLAIPSMGEGSSHDHGHNCPILFGGKGVIAATGKRVGFAEGSGPTLNGLHVALLKAYGIDGAFGNNGAVFGDDGTTPIDGIVA